MTDPEEAGDALAEATDLLRRHTDPGWTVLRPGLLDRARRAFRTSELVRGRHALGDYLLRTDVLTDRIRRAVDTVPGAAAASIVGTTGDQDELTEVTVQIAAGYGAHLPTVAAQVHDVTHAAILDLLGDLSPAADAVHTHVQIDDVYDDRDPRSGEAAP